MQQGKSISLNPTSICHMQLRYQKGVEIILAKQESVCKQCRTAVLSLENKITETTDFSWVQAFNFRRPPLSMEPLWRPPAQWGTSWTHLTLIKATCDQDLTEGKAQARGGGCQGRIGGGRHLDKNFSSHGWQQAGEERKLCAQAWGKSEHRQGWGGGLGAALMLGTARESECPMSPSSTSRSFFEHLPVCPALCEALGMYWVGQKCRSGFSVTS